MKRRNIIILISLLVIGFASVTTSLILNGNIGVGVELEDFDVIFVEALLDGKEDSKAIISEDKKTITFETDKLSSIGEQARLDYKVKNTSTQYDADVTINCTNEASEYVEVKGEFDGNSLPLENNINIKAQEIKNGYINAKLIKAYVGEDDSIEISCKITFTATSRENYAYSLTFDSNGGNKIEDKRVELNESYGELDIPEKEGYTFIGWYDENDTKVNETTKFDTKGNRNLYAKWEVNTYLVNIVTNENGTSKNSSINVAYGRTTDIKITPDKNYYISNVDCSEGYTVENYNSKVPTYGEQTITIKNNEILKNGTCTFTFAQGIYEFGYTGNEQEFIVPLDGNYKIELWGAGNAGSYVAGEINLLSKFAIYVYVGGQPVSCKPYTSCSGLAYNGGGAGGFFTLSSHPSRYAGGGGATDVRLLNGVWSNFESLKARIMVAAGSGSNSDGISAGGGLVGYTPSDYNNGKGGSQVLGGTATSPATNGGFGFGGNGYISDPLHPFDNVGFGAGGGYYGGGGGLGYKNASGSSGDTNRNGGGGGGSSFISGHNGCDAIAENSTQSSIIHTGQSNHYSGYVFTDTVMIDGAGYKWTDKKDSYTGMPTHDGTSTMTGNSGNGYAKITLLSID